MDDSLIADGGLEDAPLADVAMMESIDDLFGDPVPGLDDAMPISIPFPPLPASVILRTAETQRTGCCTRLAWSHTGCIAEIRNDGREIVFRTLLRKSGRGEWKLTEPSSSKITATDGVHFVHIQFSGSGTELAVAADSGAVHIYTSSGSLAKWSVAPDDRVGGAVSVHVDSVIGIMWLPALNELRAPQITPATKVGNRWVTQMRQRDPATVKSHFLTDGRSALLHVSSAGVLTLLYQGTSGLWQSLTAQVDALDAMEDSLTHAAIGDGGDHWLLATHTFFRHLRLYSITIDWPTAQRGGSGSNGTNDTPTINVKHLTAIENPTAQNAEMARLTHLRVFADQHELGSSHELSAPTVLAVFSHAPMPSPIMQQQQDPFSVIARWQVSSGVRTLHESFTKLAPNTISAAFQDPVLAAIRQSDILTSKVIVDLDLQPSGTLVAFVASDGSVEFREQVTYNTVEPYGDTTTVSSYAQSGFEHLPGTHSPGYALSPDRCMVAYITPQMGVATKAMSFRYGWQVLDVGDDMTDASAFVETALVCIARQHALLSISSASTSEILCLLPAPLDVDLRISFLRKLTQVLGRSPDLALLDPAKQQQTILRDPLTCKVMSAQLALATPRGHSRDFAGQYAYSILGLRHATLSLATMLHRDNASRIALLPSIAGLLHWTLDMFVFITDDLATLQRGSVKSDTSSLHETCEKFIDRTGSPAMHLLLCSFPRTLLKLATNSVITYVKHVHVARSRARTLEDRVGLEAILDLGASTCVPLPVLQEFLIEVDTAMRTFFAEGSVSAEKRVENELVMTIEGKVPADLEPVLQTIFRSAVPKLLAGVDMSAVYFKNTTWLGIEGLDAAAGESKWDVVTKRLMHEGSERKTCRRCGEGMEEIEEGKLVPPWLERLGTHCVCQDEWWVS